MQYASSLDARREQYAKQQQHTKNHGLKTSKRNNLENVL